MWTIGAFIDYYELSPLILQYSARVQVLLAQTGYEQDTQKITQVDNSAEDNFDIIGKETLSYVI